FLCVRCPSIIKGIICFPCSFSIYNMFPTVKRSSKSLIRSTLTSPSMPCVLMIFPTLNIFSVIRSPAIYQFELQYHFQYRLPSLSLLRPNANPHTLQQELQLLFQ